jgi:hypothetical protein
MKHLAAAALDKQTVLCRQTPRKDMTCDPISGLQTNKT